MTKTFSMVSNKNHNLNANEGCVIFLTFKLITCYIDGFILNMKSQSVPYLLNGREHIYWNLDIENEGHIMWVIWTSGLRECNGNFIFQSRAVAILDRHLKYFRFVLWGLPKCAYPPSAHFGPYPPPPKSL